MRIKKYFNPRTPCGVRPVGDQKTIDIDGFQSTHPLRGATISTTEATDANGIFQSTHPLRGATSPYRDSATVPVFQSTHPLRGATIDMVDKLTASFNISIHAPLAGCDALAICSKPTTTYFNPRTPCGVRLSPSATSAKPRTFQSTHPLRGATRVTLRLFLALLLFQSTHPLRGATIKE